MRIVNSAGAMQRLAQSWRRSGTRVAFVPTMGYLHAGHLSLMRRARQLAGSNGRVVVSLFVNPTQFGPREDFSKYPRDLAKDAKLCRGAGVDVLFAPETAQMYPADEKSPFSTYVVEEKLSQGMEGTTRPTHFRGVTTVVAKLFNIVLPDAAVFGAKDFQQAAIIRRMVRDLNFPVRIVVAPTVRERDGLAMSSRNSYLNPGERAAALVLWQALQHAQKRVKHARKVPAAVLEAEVGEMVRQTPSARLDYVAFFHPDTLAPVSEVAAGSQMALAVSVGKTRLIDNAKV